MRMEIEIGAGGDGGDDFFCCLFICSDDYARSFLWMRRNEMR